MRVQHQPEKLVRYVIGLFGGAVVTGLIVLFVVIGFEI